MRQLVRQAKIIGTGSYLPEKILTNKYLESIVNTNDKWIYDNLGIKERRIAAPNEATSDLGSVAGMEAIKNAGLTPMDVDLIIVATSTPDRLVPSTACIVQDKTGAYNAVCFDLAAVCSGFLYGMSVACQYIASGVYDNVVVIGADTFSRITDWRRRDCVFFGDGAGAAVLSHADDSEGFLAFRLYSDGRGRNIFTVPAGGSELPASSLTVKNRQHFYQMNGKAVYDTATKVLPEVILEVLNDSGIAVDDVKYLIPHQPGINILKDTARIIGLPFRKVKTNMHMYANTSAGTIPILLDEVNRAGDIDKGDIILFAAVGSGWTYGASVIKWA
ncbi:MAG: ketoacyl-ACP synthase III [Bacteroidales bacterium]|nr:ketoacyl-ACP synthase III [Bacteroidales bacterium]